MATAGPGEDVVATLETWSSQLDKFESRAAEYDDLLTMMGSGSEAETDTRNIIKQILSAQ